MKKRINKYRSENITICSVSFGCKEYLDANWNLTTYLNKNNNINWIVADNAFDTLHKRIPADDKRFTIFNGVKKNNYKANEHHAEAIIQLLNKVESKYLLILDPDFYIIKDNWIAEVLSYMYTNRVDILGSQWHPSAYGKVRYFPAVHCLFIDLESIDIDDIDIRPSSDVEMVKHSLFKKYFLHKRPNFDIVDRFDIGTSRDTGYRLKEIFGKKRDIKTECFTVSFKNQRSLFSRTMDAIVPDRYSFTPKKRGYTTKKTFIDTGLSFDPCSKGWEEYFWNGKPFGFHVRRYPKRKRNSYNVDDDMLCIEKYIKEIIHKV